MDREDWVDIVGLLSLIVVVALVIWAVDFPKPWELSPTHAYVDIDNDGSNQVYISGKNCGTELVDGRSTVVKCDDLVVITRSLPGWWKVVVVPEDGQ